MIKYARSSLLAGERIRRSIIASLFGIFFIVVYTPKDGVCIYCLKKVNSAHQFPALAICIPDSAKEMF